MKNKKILAIIGVRSGSKGIKNKNIKYLGNKPLIGWILETAKRSKYINRIIVSTDSEKYRKIVNSFKIDAPFLRPKKISKDSSDEIEMIKHTLNFLYEKQKYKPDIVVRLLATVPFQKVIDIDKSIKLILKKKFNSSVVVAKAKQHPNKSLKLINRKYLVSNRTKKGIDVGRNLNRQKQIKKDDIYFRANVISCKIKVIDKYNSLTDKRPGCVLISNKNFIDIDNQSDFDYAEYLLSKNKHK